MNQHVHPIHTPCKKCVFAKYDGITQTDCALNYLDIYKKQNIEVLEAYDEDNEFFVINDKKCIGYRENKWFDQFEDEHTTLEAKLNLYYKMNKLNYLVVINLKSLSVLELDEILKNLVEATVSPQKIIFVRYRDESLSFSYDMIEDLIKKHNILYSWRIQTMLDSSIEYDEILHQITMANTKYRFILSIDANDSKPQTLVNKANKIVHEDLGQFIILSNNNKKCKIFSGTIYRFGVSNHQDIFQEKSNYIIV